MERPVISFAGRGKGNSIAESSDLPLPAQAGQSMPFQAFCFQDFTECYPVTPVGTRKLHPWVIDKKQPGEGKRIGKQSVPSSKQCEPGGQLMERPLRLSVQLIQVLLILHGFSLHYLEIAHSEG